MKHLFQFLAGVILCVISLRMLLAWHNVDIFASTHTRIDGILEGVLLAILYHYAPETFRRLQRYQWVWVAVILAAILYFRMNFRSTPAASLSFDFANATGVALLMLLYRHREGRRRPALYRFVAWIGLYSYGIYLWHASVVAPSVAVMKYLPHWLGVIWIALAPLFLGVVVGIFFTKIVEFPALRLRDKLFPRPVDSAVGIPAEIEAASK